MVTALTARIMIRRRFQRSTNAPASGLSNVSGRIATNVAGASAVLRLFQTGSVRSYAASTFVGVVLILGYYLWR